MKVTVEGQVTSAQQKTTNKGKQVKDLMLLQPGEQTLTRVRVAHDLKIEVGKQFTAIGRLVAWKTSEGIGMMVIAEGV